ncbi:MAG: hypothetical protein U1E97_04810 [Alphaproteobacteria bacterium]
MVVPAFRVKTRAKAAGRGHGLAGAQYDAVDDAAARPRVFDAHLPAGLARRWPVCRDFTHVDQGSRNPASARTSATRLVIGLGNAAERHGHARAKNVTDTPSISMAR